MDSWQRAVGSGRSSAPIIFFYFVSLRKKMPNLIRTELKEYKLSLNNTRLRIDFDYTLDPGSYPKFRRNGRVSLFFYQAENFHSHFLRYRDQRFSEGFTIFLPPHHYLSVVDLIRNESPVFFYARLTNNTRGALTDGRHEVGSFSLSTDKEQIGEDDVDAP